MKNYFILIFIIFFDFFYSQTKMKCGKYEFYDRKTSAVWAKIRYKNKDLVKLNNSNNTFVVSDCESIFNSPDHRILFVRELVSLDIPQDSMDFLSTYEAPFTALDLEKDSFANYVTSIDKKLVFFSNSNGIADFIGNNSLIYENNVYYLSDEFLKMLPELIKKKKIHLEINDLKSYFKIEDINTSNNEMYNNIAYFMIKNNEYKNAIFLLKEILEKYPIRVVAWLNLADAQWQIGEKSKAKISYQKYISLIKSKEKSSQKIPERVYERIR